MSREPLRRIGSGPRLSQAVIANGFVFLSGQATSDPSQNIFDQTREILARIDTLLAGAGSGKDRIALADIALADINDYADMNRAWDEWVDKTAPPARVCAEKRVSRKPYLIEISIIAAV